MRDVCRYTDSFELHWKGKKNGEMPRDPQGVYYRLMQIKLPSLGDILELIFFRKRLKIEGVLI